MAIPTRTRTTVDTTIRLVHSVDPDVTPPDEDTVGWFPAAAATYRSGADVVEVRPLDLDQEAHCNDSAMDAFTLSLRRCRCGVVSVNGKKGDEALEKFLKPHGCNTLVVGLASYIDDLTLGEDPRSRQEASFRAYERQIALLERRQGEQAGETEDDAATQ